MKKLPKYYFYILMLTLNCVFFLISFITCFNLFINIKLAFLICSIFLFGILLSFSAFNFEYNKHINNSCNHLKNKYNKSFEKNDENNLNKAIFIDKNNVTKNLIQNKTIA